MYTLEGIRVIDASTWAFVPSAACIMASWGADVVKVENPRACDPMRLFAGSLEPGDASMLFKHYNRGKRAMSVDIGAEQGREVLYQLVAEADVFMTNYLAPVRKKLKIDVDDLKAINPKLIYVRGSGQGPKGPDADRGGFDMATWWCRGSLAASLMQVAEVPEPTGMVGHGDGMAGMTLAGGICAALFKRERSGEALVVDASLLATAIWFNGLQVIGSKMKKCPIPTNKVPRTVQPAGTLAYRTRDDRFIQLLFLGDPDALWQDLWSHTDQSQLANDVRYASTTVRQHNNSALITELEALFAQYDLSDWQEKLASLKGVWAPVQTARELHDDPQTLANQFIQDVDYPNEPLSLPSVPIMFNEDSGQVATAPDFCQHTDEVLTEFGYTEEAIERLKDAGIIA